MGQYYKPVLGVNDAEGRFVPQYWAYSHEFDNGLKLMEHSWVGNNFVGVIEAQLLGNPMRVVWAGDYADEEPDGSTLYAETASDSVTKLTGSAGRPEVRYVVNHERSQYVDITHCMHGDWTIHPLPLLTVEGNGRGGGDYFGADMEHVGIWARDPISVEGPDWSPPAGFSELTVRFAE